VELILVVVGAIVVTAIAQRRGLEPALIIVVVGIAAQRVGPEPGHHVGDVGLLDDLAHRRPAQIGAVLGAQHPHPHLPDGYGLCPVVGQRPLGERPVQAEMQVHDATALVVVEEMLAPRTGLLEHMAVDRGGPVDEPALRAGHDHRRATESALMLPRQPVQSVSFGHPLSLSHRPRRQRGGPAAVAADVDTLHRSIAAERGAPTPVGELDGAQLHGRGQRGQERSQGGG